MKAVIALLFVCALSVQAVAPPPPGFGSDASDDEFWGWGSISSWFHHAANTIAHTATNVGNTIAHTATNVGNDIKNTAVNTGNTIKNTAVNTGNTIKNTAVNSGNTIKNTAVNTGNTIKNTAVNTGNTIKNTAVEAGDQIAKYGTEAYNVVANDFEFAQEFIQAVKDWENVNWHTGAGLPQAIQETADACHTFFDDLNALTGGLLTSEDLEDALEVVGFTMPEAAFIIEAGEITLNLGEHAVEITALVEGIDSNIKSKNYLQVINDSFQLFQIIVQAYEASQ